MDAEHYRVRDFLTRTAQPYEWHEAGSAEAEDLLQSLGLVDPTLPVFVDGEGTLTGATVEKIMVAWDGRHPPKQAHYDFVVIGAGPAGLAAAVYAASDGLSTLVATGMYPGARPRTRRGSRTFSASLGGSAAPSWRGWPVGRRKGSAPSSS